MPARRLWRTFSLPVNIF
uniref:Uncharacterized protein n=1 Tax=Arundo donax TaxID=35708 RepID=A0A0A9AIE4_ARUDO